MTLKKITGKKYKKGNNAHDSPVADTSHLCLKCSERITLGHRLGLRTISFWTFLLVTSFIHKTLYEISMLASIKIKRLKNE